MQKLLRFKPTNNDCDFDRIGKLQSRMNSRKPTICPERAEIVTDSFKRTEGEPMVIRRAKALAETLAKMTVYAEPDSLIIGNHASSNFAAPIFPEYSYDWVIEELDTFEHRRGDHFNITEDTKERLRALESYWKGKTHKEEVLRNLPEINLQAEKQGVIHRGGISMSGDGHVIPNHEFILEVGFGGVVEIAKEKLKSDNLSQEQRDFYEAVIIAMEGALVYCDRLKLTNIYKNFMQSGVKGFHEAVQVVYLVHLIMMIESNGHSVSFGRFDQYIYPYYERDLKNGNISKEKALEIITHFFIMLNSLNKVRPWGHTQYSLGYPLYSALTVGGMKPDGTDGTNDISYLCLEAMNLSRMPDPNLCARFWEHTPHEFILDCARLIRTGFGMPSMFCDEVCIPAMMTLDVDLISARDYASTGCVEPAIPGQSGHRATGMTYINFGKVFEVVLNNGKDPASGVQLLELEFNSYEELWNAWETAISFYFDLAVACDLVCDSSLKYHDTDVFASSIIGNSLERGKTLKNGGAKYDHISQSNIGMSVVGDSLAAVKKLVYEEKSLTLEEIKAALANNFEGQDGARIRQMCRKAPKFGNDDDYVDSIVADVFNSYLDLLPNHKTDRFGQGPIYCGYTMSTSNISSYVPNGFAVGATPDGRLAGKPLNEGASPCLGADHKGPTAVVNSVSKLPNKRVAGGQLLNMRFTPGSLAGDDNLEKFACFIEAGRLKNIFHNQFNIVDSETLRKAKERPHEHMDLMVRVAGYCALFTTLMPEAQDAIIARTEMNWE